MLIIFLIGICGFEIYFGYNIFVINRILKAFNFTRFEISREIFSFGVGAILLGLLGKSSKVLRVVENRMITVDPVELSESKPDH